MRRFLGRATWVIVFLAGVFVGVGGAGWFLGEFGQYQWDLFRLYTVQWEMEEATEQYREGDPRCAVASLEHLTSILRFYLDQERGFALGPDKTAYAWDLAATYERLARLAERDGDEGKAVLWRGRAAEVLQEHRPWGKVSFESLKAWVDQTESAPIGDRTMPEFGFQAVTVPPEQPTPGARPQEGKPS